MNSYFLRSPRLGFRLWSPADIELAMRLWGDPRVTEFIGGPFDRTAIQERLAREIAMMRDAHACSTGRSFSSPTIDTSVVAASDPTTTQRRSSNLVSTSVRITGARVLHLEATGAVMDHAFRSLDVRGLFAGHHPENHASRHLLRKLGFRYTHDELYPATGCQHPSYAMNREEYLIARRVDAC